MLLDLEFGKSDTMQDFGRHCSHNTEVWEESDVSKVNGYISQYAPYEKDTQGPLVAQRLVCMFKARGLNGPRQHASAQVHCRLRAVVFR